MLNKKLSQNIVNEVIDTALPARNLDLIKTVNGLNTGEYQGHKQVYNATDGKLYTWNGSKYLENGIDASGIRIKTTQLVGTLQADQIGANTIGAGALQAGAVRAEHMAAGQITADKLAIGLGGNLLYNPIFDNYAYGWNENRGNGELEGKTTSLVRRTSDRFNGLVTNGAVLIAEVRANSSVSSWWEIATQVVRVVPNQKYCLSAFVDAWQCTGELMVQEIVSDGVSWISNFAFSGRKGRGVSGYSQSGVMEEWSGSINPSTRTHVFFTAPSSGYVSVVCIMRDIQTASVLKIANSMLEECTEYTTQPSPWQNAGVTAIHGGSIVTNSITTQQMAANSITANEIATGAVAAKHIAAGSIGAEHIATRSLTSDKLNVSSLSAISSDIGRINAGDITGVNIHGNNINGNNISGGSISGTTITGTTINGTDINGGTIRGARLEGVTGKFTGTLEVNQLVGGNLCEVFVANVNITNVGSDNDRTGFYTATLHINPSPVKRIVFIVNSDISFIVNANERRDYYYSKTSKAGHPPEVFGFNSEHTKICVTAYAVSDTQTIYQ